MNIRMLMCTHKLSTFLPPLFEAIQCGAALNSAISDTIPDNTGDNISAWNREYCELTAHYFAWKNIQADYYGFCHYRRFFCAQDSTTSAYLARGVLSEKERTVLLRDEEYWRSFIQECDIIAPKSEDMGITVGEHYCTSRYHYAEDLELFMELIRSKAPQLCDVAEEYLAQRRQYFCNMFVMKAELFREYCDLLFGILAEFDKRKTLHGDFQSDRTDGYLGELFTGIYINYCRKNGAVIKEVPRLDVGCSFRKRLGCAIFPSESRRRFMAKKLVKKLRGK